LYNRIVVWLLYTLCFVEEQELCNQRQNKGAILWPSFHWENNTNCWQKKKPMVGCFSLDCGAPLKEGKSVYTGKHDVFVLPISQGIFPVFFFLLHGRNLLAFPQCCCYCQVNR
jgi:hypothetical protein